jgi:hypothetical protein
MTRFLPAEIARRTGLNKSTVSRQLRQWPHLVDEAGTVDLDAYLAARAGGVDPLLQTRGVASGALAEPSELVRERTRKLAAEAERAELELRARKAELVDRDAAFRAVQDAFIDVRSRILAAAREAAPDLARLSTEEEMRQHLETVLRDAMTAISVEYLQAGNE